MHEPTKPTLRTIGQPRRVRIAPNRKWQRINRESMRMLLARTLASSQLQTAELQKQALALQQQLADMQAKVTERGVVLTLGDVLFTTGKADLKSPAAGNLNKLVAFLGKYPDRTVLIEGYTDNTGSADYNQGLSQRRADGVKAYLAGQGVGIVRLTSLGKGGE